MAQFVLVSSSSSAAAADLQQCVVEAGFAVKPHILGSTPAVDFASIAAAVVDVGDRLEAAVAQTRRWRSEAGDEVLPIAWLLSSPSAVAAAAGIEAGADAVLARPVAEAVLTAQVRSMARARAAGLRLSVRADEARLLGEQLQKAYAQMDRDRLVVRLMQQAWVPRLLPRQGAASISVRHVARSRPGGDFHNFGILDEHHLGFILGDVLDGGSARALFALFVMQTVARQQGEPGNITPPGELLTRVNRELLRLDLEFQPVERFRPLVAMMAGTLNSSTGEVKLARAGLPAPILATDGGGDAFLSVPGPFLGTAEMTYPTVTIKLGPGDKLVLVSDAARTEGDPAPGDYTRLREAVRRHRERTGQAFVDTVAGEVLAKGRHEDDVTVMGVEVGKSEH